MSAAALLQVSGLQVGYRATDGGELRALDGIDIELGAGEVLGLVGESGSGKSQLLLALLGLLPRTARVGGSVRYRGTELQGADERTLGAIRGARIAMMFQDPMTALNPYLTIGSQFELLLRRHRGLTRGAARARATALLDAVWIDAAARRLRQYPHELSGGMRQRVLLALALACEPEILLADEPTTALDATVQQQILELLRETRARTGTAIIVVSHDLAAVATLADRIAVMYAGRCVEEAATATLFAASRHPYTRALLRCLPSLTAPLSEQMPGIAGQPPDPAARSAGCAFAARCDWMQPDCRQAPPALQAVAPGQLSACLRAAELPVDSPA